MQEITSFYLKLHIMLFFSISTHNFQIIVDKASQTWTLYDAGPRHVRSPLVCLPPVCGTADVFFRQLLDLTTVGYRVISVRKNTM